MIKTSDPKFKEIINEIDDREYNVDTKKMPAGESIACKDDNDMTIIKEPDGTILLSKKAFSKRCFY